MGASSATRLPPPPLDLASRILPIKQLRGLLFRIHRPTQTCLHFGKNGEGRFDDPLKKYGVLYAALKSDAAFAEVFLRQLSLMLVSESDLRDRSLSEIICKSIACVDLTGSGLRQLSCDNRISTEKPYCTRRSLVTSALRSSSTARRHHLPEPAQPQIQVRCAL